MKSNINLLLDSICKNGIDTDSEQQIRNSISKVLGRLNDAVRGAETDDELDELKDVKQRCLMVLGRLQNECLIKRSPETAFFQRYDLTCFLYNIFSAADLNLCSNGLRIFLNFKDRPVYTVFEISSLQTALYNMTVCLAEISPIRTVMTVEMEVLDRYISIKMRTVCGHEEKFCKMQDTFSYVAAAHAASLHGGTMLVGRDGENITCSFRISRELLPAKVNNLLALPSFIDLVCDSMSPMYISMSKICSCPL